jgi:hypothetical protein
MKPGPDEQPVMEVTNMRDTKSEQANGKLKIGALKLKRETLRELDAGELEQAQGGAPHTLGCEPTDYCTRRRCGGPSKKC